MSRSSYGVVAMKSLIVILVFIVSCVFLSANATAATSPLDMIRSTTDQALKVLADASDGGRTPNQQQLERMWEIVLPRFDTKAIAQRALGVNWQKLTEDQKNEFMSLFVALVKNNYTDTLKRYSTQAKVSFDQEHTEGDQAEVQTHILSPA